MSRLSNWIISFMGWIKFKTTPERKQRLFLKQRQMVEVKVHIAIREGFITSIEKALERVGVEESLFQELAIKASIVSFYQSMLGKNELTSICNEYALEYGDILEQEYRMAVKNKQEVIDKYKDNAKNVDAYSYDDKNVHTVEADQNKSANVWKEKSRRHFDADEIDAIKDAEVVSTPYGNSVCFHMKEGSPISIPLSAGSLLKPGDVVDITKVYYVILHKDGEKDIAQIET